MFRRDVRFKFVSMFGDGQPHQPLEQIQLGRVLFKISLLQMQEMIFDGMKDGLIQLHETERIKNIKSSGGDYVIPWYFYNLIISKKGDEILRMEQISRGGDIGYYKNYDRSAGWGGPTGEKGFLKG